jgi:hypothetical protein
LLKLLALGLVACTRAEMADATTEIGCGTAIAAR